MSTESMNLSKSRAVVLRSSSGRFFYKFGKNNRIMTAWSLSGAKLFLYWDKAELEKVEAKLSARKNEFVRVEVFLEGSF